MKNNPPARSKKEKIFSWLLVLILFLITLWSWWSSVYARFNFDDIPLIVENPYLRSFEGIIPLLKTGRPVRALSFWLDYHLWGLDARGFHFTNLLIHCFCVLAVYFLFLKLFSRQQLAFFSSVIFAIHPAGSEAIIGIAHRKELLCLLFLVLSYLCFLKKERGIRWLGLSLGFYLLALFSKQVAISLPFLVILGYLIFNQPAFSSKKRMAIELSPFFFIPALAFAFSFSDFKLFARFAPADFASYHYWEILATQLSTFPRYLQLSFFPAHLQLDYYVPLVKSFLNPRALSGLILFLACWVILAVLIKRKNPLGFAWGWLLINLLPVMNWVPANFFLAERYLYLSLPGAGLLLGLILEKAGENFPVKQEKNLRLVLFLGNFLALGLVFSLQFYVYQRRLWEGGNPLGMGINLSSLIAGGAGAFLVSGIIFLLSRFWERFSGKLRGSIPLIYILLIAGAYLLALCLVSRLSYGYWGLPSPEIGESYQRWLAKIQSQAEPSSPLFRGFLPFGKPELEYAYALFFIVILQGLILYFYNFYSRRLFLLRKKSFLFFTLGFVLGAGMLCQNYFRLRDWGWDPSLWKATIRENPYSFVGWNNLGRAYVKRKKYSQARNCFIIAHSLQPLRLEPLLNLGNLMLIRNKLKSAEHYYQWVLKLHPYNLQALLNLGNCLMNQKEYHQASKYYLKALKANPRLFQASYNLAVCFYQMGNLAQAYLYAQRSLSLAPEHQPSKALLYQILKKQAQPSRQ